MYDNEFETKENKIWTKDKIEPQHMHDYERVETRSNFCRRGQYLDFFFHVLCRNIESKVFKLSQLREYIIRFPFVKQLDKKAYMAPDTGRWLIDRLIL